MGQNEKQQPVLVLLDDEIDITRVWSHFLKLSDSVTNVEVAAFNDDLKAAEFVSKHADRVVGYVQDLFRPQRFGTEKTCAGVSFYNHVISEYTPDAKSLICSGHANDNDLFLKDMDRISVLAKPMSRDDFIERVRWVLTPIKPPVPVPDIQRAEETCQLVQMITPHWTELCKYLSSQPNSLHRIEPRTFEMLVAEMFRSHGWEVEVTAQSRDGGFDILAMRRRDPTNIRILVEAKRWSPNRPVGVSIVRSLYGLRASQSFSQVVLATSSYVSQPAKQEFMKVVPWELDFIERDAILRWCKTYTEVDVGGDWV